MRTFDEIREISTALQNQRSYVIRYMQDIRRHYEADWVVPLPELANEPDAAQFTPSLITDTIDGLGMRAASISPMTFCPSKSGTITSQNKATTRRKIINATYDRNKWKVKRRRYYRHLCAYDTGSIFVEPDFKTGTVRMNVRDPLNTFPEASAAENVEPPNYVAFINRFSGAECRRRWAATRSELGGPITANDVDKEWDVVEWVDHDQLVFGLLGPAMMGSRNAHIDSSFMKSNGGAWMQLGPAIVNRAGVCLAVTPQEVSLHSVGTRLNALLGNVKMQSKLMALEVMAQQKAIFPDMFVIGNENESPQILGGAWQDGTTGAMNLLKGVRQVGQISQTPDMRNQAMIDRLERNTRVSGGLNPQMGGESYGSLRTGRALDSMMASSVDPRIQEMHEVTEAWMPQVNRAILETYKGWFGEQKFEYFSGWPGDKGLVKFTPLNDIDSTENIVEYSIPGADVVQQTQVLGSMLGAGVISEDTFQSKHPWIEDPVAEREQITKEAMFKAMIGGVQEQIASGQMPAAIAAKLYAKIDKGMTLPEALVEIDAEIRAEQEAAQQAAMEQDPMAGMGPGAQMGLAAGPGAAAPGAIPPGMMPPGASGPPGLAPGGPTTDMASMLQAAMAGAPG